MRVTAFENDMATGAMVSNAAWSPPHITVNAPFFAPASPPETGASKNCNWRDAAIANNSRATSAEVVL
jgi:hypothetical protein